MHVCVCVCVVCHPTGMVILLARYGADLFRDCGEQWWTQAPDPGTSGPLSGLVDSGGGPEEAAALELVSKPNLDVTVPLQFFVKVRAREEGGGRRR